MKMLKAALNGIAKVFAQMAKALETKDGLVAQVKTLETKIEKLVNAKADGYPLEIVEYLRSPDGVTRRSLTKAKKKKLVEKQAESGLSVAKFCRKHKLSASTFYYWQKIHKKN